MACGTPLVVSRGGAIPEVVGQDGLCADLVEPGDVGEMADAIGALLDAPARRTAMSRAGRLRALEHYSWTSVAVATVGAYERAIAATQMDFKARTEAQTRTDSRKATHAHR